MNIKQYCCFEIKTDSVVNVIAPDGKCKQYFPYVKQDIHMVYDYMGLEHPVADGDTYNVVRLYPDTLGKYTVNYDGKTEELIVEKGDCRGFIEVSKKDPRYFAYTDGTSYFLLGQNLCMPRVIYGSDNTEFGMVCENNYLGLRAYERWFKQLSENGGNMARIWLGNDYFCFDTEQINKFNYIQLEKIDMLVELAKKYNIRLKLTIEQMRYFNYDYKADTTSNADYIFRLFNKRLYAGERPCKTRDEWLTEDLWKNAWLNKINQLAMRFSGNPTIFAIELWNEMNTFDSDYLLSWNEEMLVKVKQMFPHHIVTNSLGSLDGDYACTVYKNFCWDKADIRQLHRYLDQGASSKICNSSPIKLIRDGMDIINNGKQPLLVAETGAVNNCHSGPFRYYAADHYGLIFADCVYTPLFCGSCGCGNIWHWEEYVEPKNLFPFFKPLKQLVENVDFQNENFRTDLIENEDITAQILKGDTTTLIYVRNNADTWENRYRDLKEIKAVNKVILPLEIKGKIQTFTPWNDESCTLTENGNSIELFNILHGILIKITK